MSELSVNMEGVCDRIAKEYEEAEVYDRWLPDVGDHVAVITNFTDGSSKKGSWWNLVCQLLDPDPELQGREFRVQFGESAPAGIVKAAAYALAGRKVGTIRECVEVLQESVGSTINFVVVLDKTGVYKNVRISEVVPDATPA